MVMVTDIVVAAVAALTLTGISADDSSIRDARIAERRLATV